MSHEAQRELERHALRNVRGLVDKIEGEDTASRRVQRNIFVGVVVGALLGAAVLGYLVTRGSERGGKTIELVPAAQPATAAPRAPQ